MLEIHHGPEARDKGIAVLATPSGMEHILQIGLQGDRRSQPDRVGQLHHRLKGGAGHPCWLPTAMYPLLI